MQNTQGNMQYVPKSPSMSPPVESRLPKPLSIPPSGMENASGDDSKKDNSVQNSNSTEHSMKQLKNMVQLYLDNKPASHLDQRELEIRFGTTKQMPKKLNKIDYDNIVKTLECNNFSTVTPDGINYLRIISEYINNAGQEVMSNIRTEIVGLELIQEYCRTNSIEKINNFAKGNNNRNFQVKFTQKNRVVHNNEKVKPVDFDDFNFRVSYQLEKDYTPLSNVGANIIKKWSDSKKIFRFINRVQYRHNSLPLLADISIVKTNKKHGNVPFKTYSIQEAGVFENVETYEIELEVDNSRIGIGTKWNTADSIIDAIKKGVRIVLGALQGTNYPISYYEQLYTLTNYMYLIHGKEWVPRNITTRDFIGPSSTTLQHENVIENTELTDVPNIRKNYAVTDKADGERKLLYIAENGRVYMININLNVIFTGTITMEKQLFDTLIDGEHIKNDKYGKFINLYAAFDIYYLNGQSVREKAFMKIDGEEEEISSNYRLHLLMKTIKNLKLKSIVDMKEMEKTGQRDQSPCNFYVKCKEFHKEEGKRTIFDACETILSKMRDGLFEYNTDGLIFTPCNTGVGSDKPGVASEIKKITWDMSFKWKPAQFNTIDFLVSIKKDKEGRDEISNVFTEGKNMNSYTFVKQYKTLILRCGFNEKIHASINPYNDIINNHTSTSGDIDNENKYKPVPFVPTNPYDDRMPFTSNVMLTKLFGKDVLKSEENEYFDENMIVEFRYDASAKQGWKWIPLRVRYDKTNDLRNGSKNYGNSYHVANDNWESIHNPITEEMLSTGVGFQDLVVDNDVYYNRENKDTNTMGLRNFHNLFVKKKLITGVSNTNDTLIDYAVGKGGDLSKWIQSRLRFVYGIDVNKNNIHDNIDGVCARYIRDKKKYKEIPGALFSVGNSASNIRSTYEAFMTEKDKLIARAIFGKGPKDKNELGEGVYKYYGIAQEGFNVSSCQFALHYFFENQKTLHNFMRNLAECTKMDGYFIGTCYDGKHVFNTLKTKEKGDGIVIQKAGNRIFEIKKLYSQTGFPDDVNSLGYPIDVYQESINKYFVEYLVNFNYLCQIMEDYGFILVSDAEAQRMGFNKGSDMFSELFKSMMSEMQNKYKRAEYGAASSMSEEEKTISFMNRYFIFKKVRNISDLNKLYRVIESHDKKDAYIDEAMDHNAYKPNDVSKMIVQNEKNEDQAVEELKQPLKYKKIKALKYMLDQYSPVVDTPETAMKMDSSNKVIMTDAFITLKKPSVASSDEKKTGTLKIRA